MSVDADRDLLKDALIRIRALKAELQARDQAASEPIAIVGIGCRFPGGADTPQAFWRLLRDGVDAIGDVPAGRWDRDAYYDANPDTPGTAYVREGGFLDTASVSGFDADFFGIAPREAMRLDPQQRLLLEVAWEALEHAGITPGALATRATGVYVGAMSADYGHRQAHHLAPRDIDPYMLTGNDLSFAAGRLSYFLGLHGPAMVVSTACSSSLVSVHLAMQAIRSGECEIALAGGVNVVLDPTTTVMLSKLRALAPDGRCKTFDARADGYGRGEGCGVIVLERLSQALAHGHQIVAVLRGSAVNHDGPSAGLTVPNGSAQESLLRKAFTAARISPDALDYVEAHGTGTALGDPIELNALARALGPGSRDTSRQHRLLVGSVKTNIGHLEPAAGIAGLIKVALALHHRQLPPHLHFETPSPHIDWQTLPIDVVSQLQDWPAAPGRTPLAGVSSFGLSGVNAHVVLEAAPETPAAASTAPTPAPTAAYVLPLSARTPEALDQLIARYDAWLEARADVAWPDICFTAVTGRTHFPHRAAIIATNIAEARDRLRAVAARRRTGVSAADNVGGGGQLERPVEAYVSGREVDWLADGGFGAATTYRRVTLPTYPFQRQTYWVLDDEEPAASVSDRVETPAAAGVEGNGAAETSLRAQLAGASAEERRGLILEEIERHTRVVLGLAAGAVLDRGRSLVSLGIDSLMSVELRDRVRSRVGVEPPLDQLLGGATIAQIGAILCAAIDAQTGDEALARPAVEHDATAVAGVLTVPLSYGQKALWFMHLSHPESAAYNVGVALRIDGAIEADGIGRAFQQLVDRHPSLRSVFATDGDEPCQRIFPASTRQVNVKRVDATGLTDVELTARVQDDYKQPFDLAQGPLLRVSLYRRSAQAHVLLLAMHHIVCDAQSCWTLLDELQTPYAGGSLSTGGGSYAEFVSWQRQLIGGAEGQKQEAFWRRQLAGELAVLDLPTDRPRPAMPGYRGASQAVVLPAALATGIKQLARGQEATLFVTLLAAFQVLLHRYTGQEDLTIGSATSGRPREQAGTIGYFVNPVALRADLSGNPTFAAFVQQMRRTVAEAIAHQDLPFPLLVERLQPRRTARHAPIFQADFSLATMPRAFVRASGTGAQAGRGPQALNWSRFDLAEEEGQFEIGLHAFDEDDRLRLVFKYDTDLFEPATIAGMMDGFLALLQAIVSNPEQRIEALRLLAPAERQRLLAMGTGPHVPESEAPTFVHELFEQQVRRAPEAIAVEMWRRDGNGSDARLTYGDLDLRAQRLAVALRRHGVGPDQLVGVCLRPSIDLVVALLAVLKAGGAYVPLDPTYPADRLAFMLRDANLCALISTRALSDRLPVDPVSTIWIEDAVSIESDPRHVAPALTLTPDHLAYVIYTSGSTGQPKGAMITHRGLSNYLTWALQEYRVEEGCGAPVSSSIAFDATITSFFAPLLAGGTITLLPDDEMIEALADVLRRDQRFSLVKITPAHLDVLAQQLAERPGAGRINAFVIGGEALRGESLRFWQQAMPETRLINEYGPTETVVGCCVYDAIDDRTPGPVPIGRAIANTRLYVLDPQREPVPPGVIGELYIGGSGVARGYINRPDLTAARFLDDPFSSEPGARMYRTGDLARWRRDGVLDYVGRIDTQIKIRGFRIEPGEIETALTAHPGVTDSLVMAREIGATGKQLVAYIVPASASTAAPVGHEQVSAQPPTAQELRRHLAGSLPEHMIPAAFVTLDAFPLTPNGKVDRAALPAPVVSAADRREMTAPRDALEMSLAAIWSELLGIGAIDIHDDFFDLGGHSLLVVRLMARISRDLGYSAPLATILRAPTIAALARQLRQIGHGAASSDSRASGTNSRSGDGCDSGTSLAGADSDRSADGTVNVANRAALAPIQTGGSRPPFFCIPGAGGNPIYLQQLARHLGSDQPFYALQGAGVDDNLPPHTTVEEMATYYLDAMTTIAAPEAGYHLVGHSLGGWVAFEMARQLRRRGYPVPLVAIIDTPAPYLSDLRDRARWNESRWIAELADRISKLLAPDMRLREEALHACSDDAARLELFRQTLVSAGAFPPEGDVASLRRTLDVFKAHAQVNYSVEPEMMAGINIERLVLLRTNTPPSQTPWPAGDETWGWGRLVPTEVHCVSGDHLAVLRPPHVAGLAERLAACAQPAPALVMTSV